MAKRWPRQPRPVLDGVDLELRPGELVHVAGRNGAGKTTLLRVICGLLDADAGHVRVHGRDAVADRPHVRRTISYLSAGSLSVYTRLTVRQHFALWARLTHVPGPLRAERIAGLLTTLDLGALAGRRLDRVSAGQRQRVRIGLAFLAPGDVLLLDEPLTSLDEDGSARVHALLTARLAAGAAAIWCDPDQVAPRADATALVLDEGRLVPR